MSAALEISNLQKTYANGFEALKGIDLKVEEGDFFALLGPNGAGKSTTIGILSSLVSKSEGSVKICGIDIDEDFSLAKKQIGIVPQEFNFNVFENVEDVLIHQAGYYGIPISVARERATYYLEKLGILDKQHVQMRMLSGGMKRRLMIARALVHEPRVLILDEPTAGVDIEMRRSMYDFLRETNAEGRTIIMTTHYLEEAELLCRNVAIINQGKIVTRGAIKDLLRDLNSETFLLDTQDEIPAGTAITGYKLRQVEPHCLEVELAKGQDLAPVFAALSQAGVTVVSMRNKENRLERMFVNVLEGAS
ncbi:ABC transporter ATP-binding protein [Luminiphilus sp.]|jgi:ABC-2 type transport system ATP-binding protein|nr:ABC transporter ATP-binding protein [Luminiphilus sp.]MDA8754551.1 ABC transporter ATP-binding protein [Luminiphilus sp.]MDA8946246.1 ABC transporter ATP-binding protein [Luminiphilus sp.]MDB2313383.1 ABC transporter ATP-binding protein [Luminiphilus sp.]MDB2316143.1 ABC transporter ATP-binding protein [Luminiphilus sp.]